MIGGYYSNANKNKPFRIQRLNEKELDEAITGLEERGYECTKRGYDEKDCKNYNYVERKGQKFRYSDSELQRKCWAIMRRKQGE